ncbi:hypothetical protein PRIPAC_90784 [Pristionchus pacificus]|uniref:Uncharacterized protein n=1 Tax=Pristionchus pacificus TaxID=54126 RepID=A0A2A6CVC4_PRIPA|nr:hypothetical protein PRIPAC_90784 [Pristionchus pacificus]|eukprot:PDM82050.1 hypothetical protein PRIPAC_36443 [Pristionchus pacificus]
MLLVQFHVATSLSAVRAVQTAVFLTQAIQAVCPQAVKTARDLGEEAKQILHSREKRRHFPMFFPLLSLLSLAAYAAAEDAAVGEIPLLSGNGGLTGAGYGDAYGGKVAEGVHGIGGRAGGQLGLTGLLGLGGGRKKRQDFPPFSFLIPAPLVDPVPPTQEGSGETEEEGRQKRDASATADATANGGDASATANAAANPPPAASATANANATSNGGNASAVASAIANQRRGSRTTAVPAARKRRQANASANALASAAGKGSASANAAALATAGSATAAPVARRKRQVLGFVPFESLGFTAPAPEAATGAPEAPATEPC